MPPLARQHFGSLQGQLDTFGGARPSSGFPAATISQDIHLGSGQIDNIVAGQIETGVLKVGTILTVGTSGAQRVAIVGNQGIQAYDSGNNLTGQWDSATGKLWSKSGGFGGTLAAPICTLEDNGIMVYDTVGPTLQARLGKLDGITDATFGVLSGYGLWTQNGYFTGAVSAVIGNLGGWVLGADYLRDAGNQVGLASTVTGGDDVRFWAGDTFANRSTTADVRIFESGTIHLGSNAGAYLILDGPNIRIRSSNYASGAAGWNIEPGFAEFANAYVRGQLHSTVFVKDLVAAHAGSRGTFKSAGTLNEDMAVPVSGTWTLPLKSPPSGADWLFDNGDIIRLKAETATGINDIWVTVQQVPGQITTAYQNYTATYQYELGGQVAQVFPAGSPCIDYGVTGQGYIFETADLADAPYLDIRTHAGVPWTTETVRSRLGNLAGAPLMPDGTQPSGYGLYTDNGFFIGSIHATGSLSSGATGFLVGDGYWVEGNSQSLVGMAETASNRISGAVDPAWNVVFAAGDYVKLSPVGHADYYGYVASVDATHVYFAPGVVLWDTVSTTVTRMPRMRVGTVAAGALTAGFTWDGLTGSFVGALTSTSFTLTGGTFLTATNVGAGGGPAGIKISSAGLYAYSGGTTVTASIDASTGLLSAVAGTIGGWTLGTTTLTSTGVTLTSTGGIAITTTSADPGYFRFFNAGDSSYIGSIYATRNSLDYDASALVFDVKTADTGTSKYTLTLGGNWSQAQFSGSIALPSGSDIRWPLGQQATCYIRGNNVGVGVNCTPATDVFEVEGNARLLVSSAVNRGYTITRTGTGAATWTMYSPSNSTDLRWYNAADLMTLTAAGQLSIGADITMSGKLLTITGLLDGSGVSSNIGLGGMAKPTTGNGIIGIADGSIIGLATPSGGGYLYSLAGALWWKGSSGTSTKLALA